MSDTQQEQFDAALLEIEAASFADFFSGLKDKGLKTEAIPEREVKIMRSAFKVGFGYGFKALSEDEGTDNG